MSEFDLQRIEKPHLGFAVQIPRHWEETPTDLGNSPQEVARFHHPSEGIRDLMIVFRDPQARDTPQARLQAVQRGLEAGGFRNFVLSDCAVAGRAGARLDCEIPRPSDMPGPLVWAIREYFTVVDGVGYCFSTGTNQPAERASLFDAMAAGVEVFPPRVVDELPDSVLWCHIPDVRKAIKLGQEIARNEEQPLNGEHVIVGLTEVGQGTAFEILKCLGVSSAKLRAVLEHRPADDTGGKGPTNVTPSTYRLLTLTAPSLAVELGQTYVGTEHVLLALATAPDEEGWGLLTRVGIERQAVRNKLADYFEYTVERVVRGAPAR